MLPAMRKHELTQTQCDGPSETQPQPKMEREQVYVIIEDSATPTQSRIRRVFANQSDAQSYIDDPANAGRLYISRQTLDEDYEVRGEK